MLYCAIAGFLSHSYSINPEFQWTVNDCSCMINFGVLPISVQECILVWFFHSNLSSVVRSTTIVSLIYKMWPNVWTVTMPVTPRAEKQNPWCSDLAGWLFVILVTNEIWSLIMLLVLSSISLILLLMLLIMTRSCNISQDYEIKCYSFVVNDIFNNMSFKNWH